MPLFLSHVAVKIRGLCWVYIVYGAKSRVCHWCWRWIISGCGLHPAVLHFFWSVPPSLSWNVWLWRKLVTVWRSLPQNFEKWSVWMIFWRHVISKAFVMSRKTDWFMNIFRYLSCATWKFICISKSWALTPPPISRTPFYYIPWYTCN